MSFIQTHRLTKIYGRGDNAVFALNDVNIDIPKGCFAAVTGASGSGKSTLLHMLGAIDRPSKGTVILDGIDVFKEKENGLALMRRQMIGFIFQSFNLIPVLTVKENITLPLRLENEKPDEKYLEELLELLGIADRRDRLPNQLSGGQQQRVAIARALITRPAIILADEPTGNLDSRNSQEVMRLLRRAVELYQQTLVLITHDPSIAKQADGVLAMRDGRVQGN